MISNKILTEIEKDAVNRYRSRYEELGVTPQSLGWGSKGDQIERFEVLTNQIDFENKTVMDIGCGFADFFSYLNNKGYNVDYMGVDIIPDFIEYCRKEFPKQDFYCNNIMTAENLPKADILISLGTLNFKLKRVDNLKYSKLFIKKAFALTREQLIVDFLSEYRTPDYEKEDFVYYHSPENIFSFSMNLSNNIKLIHDYKPIPQKEFMIFLKRRKI